MKPLRFASGVKEEIRAAALWYEGRRADLGVEFYSRLTKRLIGYRKGLPPNPLSPDCLQHFLRVRPTSAGSPTESCSSSERTRSWSWRARMLANAPATG